MPRLLPVYRQSALWLRVLAGVCAGMIGLLAVAAQSPDLHAWFHDTDSSATICAHAASEASHAPFSNHDSEQHTDDDQGCAVTLFAHGIVVAVTHLQTFSPIERVRAANVVVREFVAPAPTRHLLPQPHAPPARCWNAQLG